MTLSHDFRKTEVPESCCLPSYLLPFLCNRHFFFNLQCLFHVSHVRETSSTRPFTCTEFRDNMDFVLESWQDKVWNIWSDWAPPRKVWIISGLQCTCETCCMLDAFNIVCCKFTFLKTHGKWHADQNGWRLQRSEVTELWSGRRAQQHPPNAHQCRGKVPLIFMKFEWSLLSPSTAFTFWGNFSTNRKSAVLDFMHEVSFYKHILVFEEAQKLKPLHSCLNYILFCGLSALKSSKKLAKFGQKNLKTLDC